MPRALFLSPHLDDVAFSCGGTFATLAMRGWETTLCTVFTRSVPCPTGFALACQLDKGLGPDVDYLALRRAEDDAAAASLGATHVARLDLPEAPHRGYASAAALFAEFVAQDEVAAQLVSSLRAPLAASDAVFVPQALGSHVDHRRVRDAVLTMTREDETLPARLRWYRDAPYVLRDPGASPAPPVGDAYPSSETVALDRAALARKLAASSAYVSQLPFQFGGEAAMRAALAEFARREGANSATAAGERFRRCDDRENE